MSDSTHENPENAENPKNIADKLKQTIDELDIDRHVNDLVIQVEHALTTARDKVATLAAEHGDDVERFLDKVSTTIDERTEGRFAPQVDKVRTTVSSGVSRLAEHRPAETTPDAAPGSATTTWPVDEIERPSAE